MGQRRTALGAMNCAPTIPNVRVGARFIAPAHLMTRASLSIVIAVLACAAGASAQGEPPSLVVDGPFVSFSDQRDATVHFRTGENVRAIVEYAGPDGEWMRQESARSTDHVITLSGLTRDTEYRYRVGIAEGGAEVWTAECLLDTEFDFSVAPVPGDVEPYPVDEFTDLYADAAEQILSLTGIDRGYCIDYGCGEGRLAFELARRSKLQIIGLSADAGAIARGRQALIEAGVYGARVTLRAVESLSELPVTDQTANLIVSGEFLATGALTGDAVEIGGKLRPLMGVLCIGSPAVDEAALEGWVEPIGPAAISNERGSAWAVVRTLWPEGAGSWTHAYGDAGQTANSFDELVRGETGRTLEVQWFGLPGPNAMIDRQVRRQGPLSTAGRLFTQGNDRIIAQDGYNGTILWSLEIPELRRTNIPRNTGNACADDDTVFVAMRDKCWALSAATGDRTSTYNLPGIDDGFEYDWAYVGIDAGRLVGSSSRHGSFDTDYEGPQFWYDQQSGDPIANVCSEDLFAYDAATGELLWTFADGLIINPTISLGDGRAYFLQSRNPAAKALVERKVGAELWEDTSLVALDLADGSVLWEWPFEESQPVVIYMVYYDGQVVTVASVGGTYHVRAFDASTGDERWTAVQDWMSDNHGHHIQHPVVAQNRLFLEPNVYDWPTGELLDLAFPGRSKCGTITAAANLLHYRDLNDEVWDLTTGTVSEFSRLRSSCWIGMISGGGPAPVARVGWGM